MGYSFRLAAIIILYAPSHNQDNTYYEDEEEEEEEEDNEKNEDEKEEKLKSKTKMKHKYVMTNRFNSYSIYFICSTTI